MGGLFVSSLAAYFVWISLFQLALGQFRQRLVFSSNFKGRIIPEDYWLHRKVNFSALSYNRDCGHQTYDLQPNSNVVLHSPNFPNLYPPNAHCLWKFQAPFIGQIKFIFTTFLMQIGKNSFTCNSDYLEITDWTGSTRFCAFGPSLGKIVITSSWVDVKFVSDSIWQYIGFKANVEFIPSNCGKSWSPTTTNGVFESPNYPFAYTEDTVCGWIIQVLPERKIQLDCTDLFYLANSERSCAQDFLAISKSGDVKMRDAVRSCGRDGPGVIISLQNRVAIVFRSDRWNSGIGFRCRFSTVSSSEQEMPEATSRKGTPSCECGNVTQRVPRIIGGNRTTSSENPWMVSITNINGNHLCSGTLVRHRFVLTAGHCVYGLHPKHVRVVLGDDLNNVFQSENLRLIEIQDILIYPGYSSQFDDLALVKIASYDINEHAIISICLPPAYLTFENETAMAIGWHRQESGSGIQHYLHQVVVPVLDHSTCQQAYGPQIISAERMMCAGSVGKDACEGDSGGPLMWMSDDRRWHIIGIISFGVGCGLPGYPGVNVRVNHYLDWLREKVGGDSVC